MVSRPKGPLDARKDLQTPEIPMIFAGVDLDAACDEAVSGGFRKWGYPNSWIVYDEQI